MSLKKLIQIKKDEKRIFTIDSSGLKIENESMFGSQIRHVPFENISNDIVKFNFSPAFWIALIISLILLFVSGLFIKLFGVEGIGQIYKGAITCLIGGLSMLFFLVQEETVIKCYNGLNIEFYKNLPSNRKLNEFIKKLYNTRNEILKEKYCFVSEFISYGEQIEKFNLLHALDIINLEEFNELKNKLESIANFKSGNEYFINPN